MAAWNSSSSASKGRSVFAVKEGSISYSLFLLVFFQPVGEFEQTETFKDLWVTSTLLALLISSKCGISAFNRPVTAATTVKRSLLTIT